MVKGARRSLFYTGDSGYFDGYKQIGAQLPAAKRVGLVRFKEIVKDQYLILLMDEERAIAALPKLLPDNRRQCQEALTLVRRVLATRGNLPEDGRRRLQRIEAIFGGPPPEVGQDKAA